MREGREHCSARASLRKLASIAGISFFSSVGMLRFAVVVAIFFLGVAGMRKHKARNTLGQTAGGKADPCDTDPGSCACFVFRDPNFCSTCPNCGSCRGYCEPIPVGLYLITNFASGRRLAVSSRQITATPRNDPVFHQDQVWYIEDASGGTRFLTNNETGLRIFAQEGKDGLNGFGVWGNVYSDQKWYIEDRGGSTWQLRNAASNRKIFAQVGKRWRDGLGAYNGPNYDDQRWTFVPCSSIACQDALP